MAIPKKAYLPSFFSRHYHKIKVAVSHWTWKKRCSGALEPAVPNYIAKFSPLIYLDVCSTMWCALAHRARGREFDAWCGPRIDFSFFHNFCFFFFLWKNHLPEVSVCLSVSCAKKTPGALNSLFQSIAFELAISGRFNRIPKEERQYFLYYEKIIMPSTSISRK